MVKIADIAAVVFNVQTLVGLKGVQYAAIVDLLVYIPDSFDPIEFLYINRHNGRTFIRFDQAGRSLDTRRI